MPKHPVYCGAITVADVMLAGFSFAAGGFDKLVAATVATDDTEMETPDFWWGPRV